MNHLSTKPLWVQEKVEKGEVKVTKIKRNVNITDSCTHAWGKCEADRHFRVAGVKRYEARRSRDDKCCKEETRRSCVKRIRKSEDTTRQLPDNTHREKADDNDFNETEEEKKMKLEDTENGDDITATETGNEKTQKKNSSRRGTTRS